jgi:hypothetical protein
LLHGSALPSTRSSIDLIVCLTVIANGDDYETSLMTSGLNGLVA